MLTLNQIITLFEDTKANHANLSSGTFYFGDPWEFAQSNEITYPFWGCVLNNSTINGNDSVTTFQMFFCDLVHKDESNETDVLSDMQLIAMDVYSQLKYTLENYYDATVNNTAQLSDFTSRFNDEVTGWELTLEVRQFYDQSTCGTTFSGNAGKVEIYDVNTNQTLYWLNPNSRYGVEQLQAIIDTITGNTTTIIDPIV